MEFSRDSFVDWPRKIAKIAEKQGF